MNTLSDFIKRVKCVEVSNLHTEEDYVDEKGQSIPRVKLTIHSKADNSPGNDTVAMRSRGSVQTCNPCWEISQMQWVEEGYLEKRGSDKHVTFVIHSVEGEGPTCHVELNFDINSLVFLGRLDVKHVFLPLNSLFLHDDDGLWVTLETTQAVPQFEPEMADVDKNQVTSKNDSKDENEGRGSSSEKGTPIDKEGIKKVRELSAKRREAQKDAKGINIVLEKDLEEWRKKVEVMEEEADEEERSVNREAAALSEVADLREASSLCRKLAVAVKDMEAERKQAIDSGIKSKFLLEARQLKLVGELQTIYPIELVRSTGRYAIRGLEMPAFDCPAREEEQLTTALGYLVHLLLLLSKYLGVPLRYQLLYFSSRSLVKDAVSGVSMPLYRKDMEAEKFKRAIVWLQRDIEQLLDTRGLVPSKGSSLLAETHRLILSLMDL